ncbi:MAG TPA: hypothetical protein VMY38_07310 [Gemmatimonadaceae bacterium]|nr:hypothetical protein [Gemmatimonadaceae bacterium]
MTVGEWLDARDPQPPDGLAQALRTELEAELGASFTEAPGVLLRAGERVLGRVLRAEPQTPAIAPDLLLADALVTYAFEAVAESAGGADQFARDALARLGGLSAR